MTSQTITQLPLFPLNNVLFPGGFLPLQVFEPRYLDMVSRRHAEDGTFGVVCLAEGREVRRPGPDGGFQREALHPVGTLVRIDTLRRPQAGLMAISCTALQRFRILRSEQQKFGLWVADVETMDEDRLVSVPEELKPLVERLRPFLEEIEQAKREAWAGLPTPPGGTGPCWNESGWVANRWCELLPLSGEEKQRLLALDNPLLRLELVWDALERLGFWEH